MKRLFLLVVIIATVTLANYSFGQIIADYKATSQFDLIPDSILADISEQSLLFRHASVGGTINDGLDCIQGTRDHPTECTLYPDYKYDRRNWDFQPRGNSGWYGKMDDFMLEAQNQIDSFDFFSFKYCYIDGIDGLQVPCGSPYNSNKTTQAWIYLKAHMDSLEKTYPDKTFIWWTIPLTQTGQFCTDTLNSLIRSYVIENKKILFDIADIEAHDTVDVHCVNSNGWEIAFKGYCGEQNPGAQACHPNWTGKIILAKAFWWMMAKTYGWGEIPASLPYSINRTLKIKNPLTLDELLRLVSTDEYLMYDLLGNLLEPKRIKSNGIYLLIHQENRIVKKVIIVP